jgi:hypothetical protein
VNHYLRTHGLEYPPQISHFEIASNRSPAYLVINREERLSVDIQPVEATLDPTDGIALS